MHEVAAQNVTTTASTHNWEITNYLGTVEAHAVAGAGLVTEFLAGFSDLIGGRSGAVQKRLSEIYSEASAQLRRKAGLLGANWIVGFSADLDQISGKNTFMFMVTVTGTAVKAERTSGKTEATPASREVTLQDLEAAQTKHNLAGLADPSELHQKEAKWTALLEHRPPAAAPVVLAWMRNFHGWSNGEPQAKTYLGEVGKDPARVFRLAMSFFAGLTSGDATQAIYENVQVDSKPEWGPELTLLRKLHLLDLRRSADLLESSNPMLRWWALQTLQAKQQSYAIDDLQQLERCLASLDQGVLNEAPIEEASGALGLGKKKFWKCLCGQSNPHDLSHCICGLNRQGNPRWGYTPKQAITSLSLQHELLTQMLQ